MFHTVSDTRVCSIGERKVHFDHPHYACRHWTSQNKKKILGLFLAQDYEACLCVVGDESTPNQI